MSEMSPASALRKIQQAQAGLKKSRQVLRLARESGGSGDQAQRVLNHGWASLTQALKLLAEIPLGAASEAVMTKQLAAQRYATALLVRLRRVARNEPGGVGSADHDDDDSDFDEDDAGD